jgi:hypothetical protein
MMREPLTVITNKTNRRSIMYHVLSHDCCSTPENAREMFGFCSPHHRRFISKSEIKEMLAKYKEQLLKEIEGVDERINELSKKEA